MVSRRHLKVSCLCLHGLRRPGCLLLSPQLSEPGHISPIQMVFVSFSSSFQIRLRPGQSTAVSTEQTSLLEDLPTEMHHHAPSLSTPPQQEGSQLLTSTAAGRGCWSASQIKKGCAKARTMLSGREETFFKARGLY